MKKFNLQLNFFILGMICIGFSCSVPAQKTVFTAMDGSMIHITDSPVVYFFLDTECPISQAYQGEFRKMKMRHPATNFIYVFTGGQKKEDILAWCHYDSISVSMVINDKDFKIAKLFHASVTPQAIIVSQHDHQQYSGKIDDRFAGIGNTKRNATINYVDNALFSLAKNEEVKIAHTEPVGCFIESR